MSTDFAVSYDRWLNALQALQPMRRLFITGCPKSGTTWLMKSLNGHPQIVANGEGRFALRFFPLLEQAVNIFNGDQQKFGSALGLLSTPDFASMMRCAADTVMHRYLISSGKAINQVKVVADKTPQHVLQIDILQALFPDCRFINIIRDPRDAATSACFHLARGDARSRDEYVQSFITQSWRLHVEAAVKAEQVMGSSRFLNIRYEDMHRDESMILRRCLKLLDVDDSAPSVDACRAAGNFKTLSGGRDRGEADNNHFFRNGQVGDWKNHLSPELVKRCCEPVRQLMDRFDYRDEFSAVTVTIAAGVKSASHRELSAA